VSSLPFIDEHAVEVNAPASAAWRALAETTEASFGGGPLKEIGAKILGCRETSTAGRADVAGSTVPGFRVERVDAPTEMLLGGRHRFARYALRFRVDPESRGSSKVLAETRADFPGVHGRAYRALVLGTRAHRVIVRRILGSVKARAERITA